MADSTLSPPDAARMTLIEHLRELRRRLVISLVAISIGAVVAYVLYNHILGFLIRPYQEITGKRDLIILDPLEGFATRLKIAAYGGTLLASPVVLWQLWRFITPGLHKQEKRYAIPFIAASILLFVLGGTLALLTFPQALEFLIGVGGESLQAMFTPARYLRLIILMMLAFGLAFEFPVLLVFLQLARVLSSAQLRKWRRTAAILIVAVAAVITPTQDPYSLFAMAGPMYLFYEGAIVIGRVLKR